MPVLPLVGSTIVSPARSAPLCSAASIIARHARSFTLPAGFWPSSLTTTSAVTAAAPAIRRKDTMGVEPISSSIDAAIATACKLPPEPRRGQAGRRQLPRDVGTGSCRCFASAWTAGNPDLGTRADGLPHRAALLGRSHHRGSGLAGERPCELRQVGQRAQHAELRHGVWVILDELPLGLDPHRFAAELTPCDEELLLRREAVDRRHRVLRHRLLEREVCQVQAGLVAERLVEHELALVVDAGLDRVALVLVDDALRAALE